MWSIPLKTYGPLRLPPPLSVPRAVSPPRRTASGENMTFYNLNEDWSQANDLATEYPAKLADVEKLFLIEFTNNKGLPVGGGLWIPAMHPEPRLAPPYTS
jgi:hypothetical protein